MNIFYKRPLGLILCVMLSAFSIFAILSDVNKIVVYCASLLSLLYIFLRYKKDNILLKVIVAAILCSFSFSFLYFDCLFYPKAFYGKEVDIEAKVEQIDVKSDYYQVLSIKTKTINGKKQNYNISLHLYGKNENITPGNLISTNAKIAELESDGAFNFKQYYSSKGVSANASSNYVDIVDEGKIPFSYKLSLLRDKISKRAEVLSNESAGALLSAFILGERDLLSGQTNLDYTRIGIVHVLSLGGMHLAILMAIINKSFYTLRVGKKWRIILGCLFSLIFMAITGFSLTIMRAGLMLIISSVLIILSGNKDSLTSLFIAAFIIVLATPYAALDIGLWLSVLATMGILVATDILNSKYKENKGVNRLTNTVKVSFAFSVFAICANCILTSISFSGASSLSLFTTLIFSFMIEVYIIVGIVVLIFGKLIPIGKVLVFLESIISKSIAYFADLDFAYASTEFLIIKLLFILLGILFFIFVVAYIKNKKEFLYIIVSLFLVLTILPIVFSMKEKSNDSFTATHFENSDFILINSEGNTIFVDASKHKKSDSYDAVSFMTSEKVTSIEYYVIAGYSDYLPVGIETVLSKIKVSEIKLPLPENKHEEEIAIEIFKMLNNFRAEASFYEDDSLMILGEYEILVPYRNSLDGTLAITFKRNNEIFSYLSSGALEVLPNCYELLYVSDYLIFGDYGRSYDDYVKIDEYGTKLKKVVIFDKKIEFSLDNPNTTLVSTEEKIVLYD